MEGLTQKQQDVLDYIKDYIDGKGESPTMTEISRHFNYKSRNSATCVVRALSQLGCVHMKHHTQRGIRLAGEAKEDGDFFTMFSSNCLAGGCFADADLFGYCTKHYAEEIDRRHDRLIKRGMTRPTPACFSERSWVEYEVHTLDAPSYDRRKYTSPCTDCTPERKQQMLDEGRCAHPETVFVVRKGKEHNDVEGINSDAFATWERACRSGIGRVVQLPPIEERVKAAEKHERKRKLVGQGEANE